MAATLLTGQSVVTFALEQIGVFGVGQSLGPSDAVTGLRRLNAMVATWSTMPLTIPVMVRETFSVTANQGTYTIGPGGNFNTIRPVKLDAAGLLYGNTTPEVEIPIQVLTDQQYAAIPVKDLTSTQWTSLWYNPTYTTNGRGTIVLWPIPTTADNDLVLYFQQPLVEFAALTTEYFVPPGYEEALGYNLALRLAPIYARPVPDDVRTLARQSLAQIKRTNTRMVEMVNDAAGIGSSNRWGYDIQSDTIR